MKLLTKCWAKHRDFLIVMCEKDMNTLDQGVLKMMPLKYSNLILHVKEKEKGCTEPLYGEKAKCVIQIVPQKKKIPSFVVDNKCIKIRDEGV